MAAQRDGWVPGVRVRVQGLSGQIVKISSIKPDQVWVKLDEEKMMQLVPKTSLRTENAA